jgi:hypothetical protein
VRSTWKTTTLAATIAAGLVLTAGCSSKHSATLSASSPGARRSGLKAITSCLSGHGADPTGLNGLLTGTPISVSASQLTALRSASKACESAVSTKLKQGLSTTVTCLNGHGYHLDASSPLSSLFSLDLSRTAVSTTVTTCAAGLSPKSSKSS